MILSFFAVLSGLNAQNSSEQMENFRVLTEQSPPGEYLGPDGKVTGATAEYVRELMKRLGIKTDMILYPWARAYQNALEGPLTAVFETARTPERENLFHWIGPIKRIQWAIYARKSDRLTIRSLEDIREAGPVAVYRGDSKADYLRNMGFTRIETPTTTTQCLQMLMLGRVRFWMYSEIGMEEAVRGAGLDPADLVPVWTGDTKYLYIALSKDTPPAMVEQWNTEFRRSLGDGTLAAKYRGVYPDDMIKALVRLGSTGRP